MISTIIFFVESHFTERDYHRLGIETLKRNFNVLILDCTPLLFPEYYNKYIHAADSHYEIQSITSLQQAQYFINNLCEKSLAVDLLSQHSEGRQIRLMLKNKKVMRMIAQLSLLPSLESSTYPKIKYILSLVVQPQKFIGKLRNRLGQLILRSPYPDMALCSGKAGFGDPRLKGVEHRIMAHSFDYDIYLSQRSNSSQGVRPYAVFLDEDMVHHSDYDHSSISAPATESAYYKSLLNFFEIFEINTGLEIIFAAHPRSRYDIRPHLLGGRKYVKGNTAQLVRDATMVLCHQSTSMNFAILWIKPIVFLTSNELISNFIGARIDLISRFFNKPALNIDEPIDLLSNEILAQIDIHAYKKYEELYIKMPGTPERPIWEIFTDYVKNL